MTPVLQLGSSLTLLCVVMLAASIGCDGSPSTSSVKTNKSQSNSGNGLTDSPASETQNQKDNDQNASVSAPLFIEAAEQTGLKFTHFNGMSGELYFIETVGGGAALLDYDRDGDLDVYITQGRMLGDKSNDEATFTPLGDPLLSDRLFRNDLVVHSDGRRELKFVDVTEAAGLQGNGYGMGVTVGDYNRDSWPDLYVTNFGSNQLWQNDQQGGFIDVTKTAGVDDPRWSTSACFFDYDKDGWLDLFVCCYEEWSLAIHRTCANRFNGAADYCGPKSFKPERDRLFRNLGNGTFQDVTVETGISSASGAALGVVEADFNGDGFADLYIANDGMPNHYWVNMAGRRFKEQAVVSGCAFNMNGQAEASMGIDAADFDNDGDIDIFMTHLRGETNTLYENDGGGIFVDKSSATKLGNASTASTGFGTVWFDYDLDGKHDLFVANGEVRHIPEQVEADDPYPLRQPNQLFHQVANFRFEDVSRIAGPAFSESHVSRGVACGDLDNDGDPDIVIVNSAGPARLLLNQHCDADQHNHWIGFDVMSDSLDGDVRGTRIELVKKDGTTQWGRLRTTASYLSANDSRIVFGLGEKPKVKSIRLHMPNSKTVILAADEIDRYLSVRLNP